MLRTYGNIRPHFRGTLKCRNPVCNRTMLGPFTVKVFEAHIPNLSEVSEFYWKYCSEKHELEGLANVCASSSNCRTIKLPEIDNETEMLALD
jgi:hypothetical protein